jgi:quercetin dioxygenase-like cupin family protein
VDELWDWTLGPRDRHTSEAHASGTQELVQVLEGAITVEVADQAITLKAGDAVSFPGDGSHSYVNTARRAARFSLAAFEPGAKSPTRGEVADD